MTHAPSTWNDCRYAKVSLSVLPFVTQKAAISLYVSPVELGSVVLGNEELVEVGPLSFGWGWGAAYAVIAMAINMVKMLVLIHMVSLVYLATY